MCGHLVFWESWYIVLIFVRLFKLINNNKQGRSQDFISTEAKP